MGDKETRGQGDKGTRGQGDKGTRRTFAISLVSLSPCPLAPIPSHLKYLSYTLTFSILRYSVALGARGIGIYKPPLI
jgi:hypothetical protein